MKNNNITENRIIIASFLLLLCTSLASATIDIVSPANSTYSNKQVTFDYYVGIDNITVNNCSIIIDSAIKSTSKNITNPGFNSFTTNLTIGNHSWSISCKYSNSSESSEERRITIDTIDPTIVLFFPLNNTQINSTSAEISFVALDDIAEKISCDIMLNNSINQNIITNNSQPATAIISGLEAGNYTWSITCYDYANNSETTETRTFKIQPPPTQPSFNITIPGTEFEIGDNIPMAISAPQGTSVRVEVCPDIPGFVECKVPVNANNVMNYPFQEWLPFTNYQGNYIVEAFFNYSGFTETKTLSYKVKNNIEIDIRTDEDQRRNVPMILEANVKGGVGALNYTWHLSNGTLRNTKKANITYATAGDYNNTLMIRDEYNNTQNKSIIITVDSTFYIKIVVKDQSTGGLLQGAAIDIRDEEKETDANGEAAYYLTSGTKEIFVLRENYTVYHAELSITKDETFTINLAPVIVQKPVVTLIRPENNSLITGTTTELGFKAEYNRTLNCSIYINENNDGFFVYLGSVEVNDASEKPFGVIELENKSYWWKVECTDNNKNSEMSNTWKFNVGSSLEPEQPEATQGPQGNLSAYDNWIKEFQQILDNINTLPKDEKEAADSLGVSTSIEDSITTFRNTIRDLDSLRFRTDLSDPDKQAEGEILVQKAEQAYQKTPISIEILSKDSFIEYINPVDIEPLLNQYLELNNITPSMSKKNLLKMITDLQQEAVISSKVKTARLTYRDGTQSDASIVSREIKTYNITQGSFIMEVIPKDVAETADEVMSSQQFEVILQDPIIKFGLTGDTTISYYLWASRDLEALKKIKTMVLVDPSAISEDNKVTGFSIKNIKLPQFNMIAFLALIIIFGGLVFVGVRYDGINTARYLAYQVYGKRKLHYISVILNEINDHLDSGNHQKAIELYDEAKDAYSELSTFAKNDVYEKVSQTADRVVGYCSAIQSQSNITDIGEMVNNIQSLLNSGQIVASLEEYKRIEATYNQLDDETREMLHPTLVALGNKVQIAIENTNNLI